MKRTFFIILLLTIGALPATLAETGDAMPVSIENNSLAFVVLAVLAVCLTVEAFFPHLKPKRRALKVSYRTNACTFLFNNITLSLLSVSSLYYIAQSYSHVGLLSQVDNNIFKWCLSFVLLDLAFYWWHYANHKLSFLWMFHKVHHSDKTLNVSTGLRFHMGEMVLTVLFKSAFIIVIGVRAHIVLIHEAILMLFVLFHHTNITFRGETWLSRILIVPKLHRLHHSARRDEHDNNYGCVFPLWDRAFGTIKEGRTRRYRFDECQRTELYRGFKIRVHDDRTRVSTLE